MAKRGLMVAVTAFFLVAMAHAATPSEPPVACFTVTPGTGTVSTVFLVDASCSTDDKTPASRLRFRWDWDGDGMWDTPFSNTSTASHAYPSEGAQSIRLEVLDLQDWPDVTSHSVIVDPVQDEALVGAPALGPGATEPDVDVNPGDPQNIVVSAFTPSYGGSGLLPYPAFFTTDGGQSWTRSLGSPGVRTGDPGVEFDTQGDVFLSSIDDVENDGTPEGLSIARSVDGGATFSVLGRAIDPSLDVTFPGGVVRNPCSAYPLLFIDYPKIAVDKASASPYRDSVYALGYNVTFDGNGDGICGDLHAPVFSLSRDAGVTWESGQSLTLGGKPTSSIGIGADGALHIIDAVSNAAICPSGSGISYRKSDDGGVSFSTSTCIYDSDGSLLPVRVWTAASPADAADVYAVFGASVPALSGSQHIFVLRSTDGGATWSVPVRVDDPVGNDVVDHYRPSVSVSPSGRIDVAWFDYRNSTPTTLVQSGQPGDAYYSFSLDGGLTWIPSLRLSASTAPFLYSARNDFLTAVSSGDLVHVVYSQDRDLDGIYEAYMATLTFH